MSPECPLWARPYAKHWGHSRKWDKPVPDFIEFPFWYLFRGTEATGSHIQISWCLPKTHLIRPRAFLLVLFGGHGTGCHGNGALASKGPWFISLGLALEKKPKLESEQRVLNSLSLCLTWTVQKPQALSLSLYSQHVWPKKGRRAVASWLRGWEKETLGGEWIPALVDQGLWGRGHQ